MSIAIAQYAPLEIICESTNTIVYRAYKELDRTSIIIKTLKAEYPSLEELTYLKHEYKIIQELEIEGIIKPLALESYQNGLALICKDVAGEPLKRFITNQKLELNNFLSIAIELVAIVAQLHQNRIIHKDIQPSNILVNAQTNRVTIIDLSLASRLSIENQTACNFDLLKGNLAYMSPEQTGRMNRLIDYRTDFYSLGITFYEMLTGELPFQASNQLELLHCHIAKAALPPGELNPEVPPAISEIVMKLLAKTAEDRYQSALGLKADLETCLGMLQTFGEISHFTAGQVDSYSQFLIPQKLYGREREVATLMQAFERVSQGTTEIILVSGYSGVGKSSLVNEVHKPIVAARGYFISGKFDQFKRNIPYASLIQAFQELIRQLLTESADKIADWKAKLLEALGSNGQVIIDVIPEVERIVGVQPDVPQLGPTESQNRFNRLFQQFIHVFTKPEHPLVVFLDDLQWADLASLKLIQLLACEPNSQYMLLMGAYRDNEVSATHPLMLTLEEIQQKRAVVNNILLQPLQIAHVNQLISDTFRSDTFKTISLAELVFNKTQGNPFFLTQLLKSLYNENLLSFNFNQGCWQWDIKLLKDIDITDNVVELMINQIHKLSLKTQNILKLAACIGDKFTLDVLGIVRQKSLFETAADLWESLQTGLVLPLDQSYKIPLVISTEQNEQLTNDLDAQGASRRVEQLTIAYKFLHDRVQQAAYALIPDSQKKETHLKIGQLLLRNITPEERKENIFALVNQLNYGTDLLTLESEKYELAELNLIAGQKAKAAAAYESAMRYLKVGLELLAVNSWQNQYELTLALYESGVETGYLNGDFEQMEKWATIVLQQAKTPIDKMKVYEVKIQACMAQVKQLEAITIGLQALELLGISFPESPSTSDIEQTLAQTARNLSGRNIEDLINLPLMTEIDKLAAVRMLACLGSPTYQAGPALLPLIACEQLNLSIKHGNSPFSAYSYVLYSIMINGLFQDIESAYQFGKLALSLVERFNAVELKTSVFFVAGSSAFHGKVHAKETLLLLQDSYSSGLENGHFEYGGYAAMQKCYYSYLIGQELAKVEREMAATSNVLAQLKQENALSWNQIFQQSILNLLEPFEKPCCLLGEAYNEEKSLPLLKQANDRTGLHYFYSNKLILCYLFGEYHQALENAVQAEQYLDGVKGFLIVPVFHFYDSLAQLAIYPSVPHSQQEHLLSKVTKNQKKMQKWAENAPMNFLHKYELVEAEKARVLGQYWQAMECYDRAIASGKENGYIQEEALANELAAEFYFSQGREKVASVYLVESYYGYLHWGATAKVKDLEARYSQILSQTLKRSANGVETSSFPNSVSADSHLDLATVIKASQALSGEIVLSNLLTKLMQIVLESAGAQKGFLLLDRAGQMLIEASAGIDADVIAVQKSIPLEMLETSDRLLPISVINYVARTQESVVLNDATAEEIFAADPYIIDCKPKSVLCAPILHQGKLTGILYLENNLTTGAFTPDRLEILQLLSAQAAISIENARLYEDLENYNQSLEAKVAERTQELEEKNLQLQQEIRDRQRAETAASAASRAKSEFLANMSHELRTPLNGILGYAQILKKETLTPQQKNGIDIIHRCGDHLLTLINDVLDLSKIEAQKMELYPTDFYLPEFLQSIVNICRIRAEQKEISLVYKTLSMPRFIRSDEKRLRQVLLNLLGNAIKFTEKGSVTFQVSDRDGKLNFLVEDTGIGMAAEQLEEIFLPFQQVGEYRRHIEGTGLGLPISRRLVQMMGSDINVESTLGKGSVFWFDLDLPKISQLAEVSSTEPGRIVGFKGDKRKILVVDDKESNRSVLVNMLEPLGFETASATDGLDALAKAREFKPDCILLDLVMPAMDGFEATRQIRMLPELAGVVVLAVSASVFDFERQQSQEVGCDDFLPKPIREADLLEKLRIHLGLEWVCEEKDEVGRMKDENKHPLHATQGEGAKALREEVIASSDFTLDLIVPPPAEQMAVLLDLAMMGDLRGILEQTARIEVLDRQYIPFALHLRQLAKGYKERQILEFVKKYSGA